MDVPIEVFALLGALLVTMIVGFLFWFWVLLRIVCDQTPYSYMNKHVVVTGGSSGIGFELAKEYLIRGANVTIVARNKDRLNKASKDLNTFIEEKKLQNVKVAICSVDISDGQDAITNAMKDIIKSFGDCDVLVNCAGVSIAAAIENLKEEDFQRMLNINVLGSIYATKALLPGIRRRGGGRIIFISSQAGQVGLHGYTAYSTSKYALKGFAEALQMEVRPDNIYVSVAYPPDTATPGYEVEMQSKPEITRVLSESGTVFEAPIVAKEIVTQNTNKIFGISIGLDGWLLKATQPGMIPVTNATEALHSFLFASITRLIAIGYLLYFDSVVKRLIQKQRKEKKTQ